MKAWVDIYKLTFTKLSSATLLQGKITKILLELNIETTHPPLLITVHKLPHASSKFEIPCGSLRTSFRSLCMKSVWCMRALADAGDRGYHVWPSCWPPPRHSCKLHKPISTLSKPREDRLQGVANLRRFHAMRDRSHRAVGSFLQNRKIVVEYIARAAATHDCRYANLCSLQLPWCATLADDGKQQNRTDRLACEEWKCVNANCHLCKTPTCVYHWFIYIGGTSGAPHPVEATLHSDDCPKIEGKYRPRDATTHPDVEIGSSCVYTRSHSTRVAMMATGWAIQWNSK